MDTAGSFRMWFGPHSWATHVICVPGPAVPLSLERWRSFRVERPGVVEPLTAVLLRPSSLRAQFFGLESVPCPEVEVPPERWTVPEVSRSKSGQTTITVVASARSVVVGESFVLLRQPSASTQVAVVEPLSAAYDRLQEY